MHGGLNTHKRQIIGHILPIFILTSYDQILEQTVSCKSFRRYSISAFIQVIQLHPDTIHQLLGSFPGNLSCFYVLLIIWIHILVKSSR